LIPPQPEDGSLSSSRIRVHLAIDDPELRSAVHALFVNMDRFEVITGSPRFSAGARVRVGYLDASRAASVPADGTPIVLIGPDMRDETILAAIRAGAWALVSELSSGGELAMAVQQAANGDCPILRNVASRPAAAMALIKQLSRPEPISASKKPSAPCPLTDSEVGILRMVATGQNTRRIADEMGFQEQTIKNRIAGIFNKLGPRSRAGAVAEAQRRGWL
jgi:DNA-binding NarL/FixJ family response regulator